MNTLTATLAIFILFFFSSAGAEEKLPRECKGAILHKVKVVEFSSPYFEEKDERVCPKNRPCRFTKPGKPGQIFIKSPGENAIPISATTCKYGKGGDGQCLVPCQSMIVDLKTGSASKSFPYHSGDVFFFPALQGKECHGQHVSDGYVVIVDTPKSSDLPSIETLGFFIGDCEKGSTEGCKDKRMQEVTEALKPGALSSCYIGNVYTSSEDLDLPFLREKRE